MKILKGIGASSGVAIAKVFEVAETIIEIHDNKILNADKEISIFKQAIEKTIGQITKIKESSIKNVGEEVASVFDAHIQVAKDPMLIDEIEVLINTEKLNAMFATLMVSKKYISLFSEMEDNYIRERAADIEDVSKRIIRNLAGVSSQDLSEINEEVIIVANDLTPSQTSRLNKRFVKGFVTNVGGRTSHAAIMARTLGIPAVVGLKNITKIVNKGDIIGIDGEKGDVIVNPNNEEKIRLEDLANKARLIREQNDKYIGKNSITKDGHRVEIVANIGSPKDVKNVNENDSEGVGLFRTEFLYMDSNNWPTEEEQFINYSNVLKELNGKICVVRTLDIGGDKKLEYFDFPEEDNPFLGYRAIRLCLDKVDIFKTQLRALLRASIYGKLAIMFPMIATIEEFLEAKKVLEECKLELKNENIAYSDNIQVGMMVEIPAAAALAHKFSKYADFFSIGTNDLMQYSMAADRMNEKVSYLYQPLNPSFIHLIKMIIDGAHINHKWVGMCGEMASDANALPILLGLGLNEFSMSASSILSSRRLISEMSYKKARWLAEEALSCETETEVKKLVDKFWKQTSKT